MFPDWAWYCYDNMSGQTMLKHPYRAGAGVPCPHCGETLRVQDYRASCCGQEFRTSFGEIAQREPVGSHSRKSGRGWKSLRLYVPQS